MTTSQVETKKVPEYQSECWVQASKMRVLAEQDILILNIFKPYRYGWDEDVRKYRSFYHFPARLTQDVVYSGDEEAKIKDGDTFSLREKYWDGDMKKFGFKKISVNGQFFKTFKKVFDVDIAPSSDAKFKVWDGTIKQEVEVTLGLGNTFTLRGVPASRIVGMIEWLDMDGDVVMVDGKDKLGNQAKVRPYDFEDAIVPQLLGRFIKFKVRGEGIDTRYTFKEGKEFDINPPARKWEAIDPNDLPFN